MNVRLVVAAAFALGIPGRSFAQDFPERVSKEARIALERIVDSARAMRLPTEPLVAKAAEGVLKGADDARIVKVVRALLHDMDDARAALPPGAATGTLTAAASALRAGVSRETLRRLAAAGGGAGATESELAIALITLADLAASRVPPQRAGEAVELLLSRRASVVAMFAFREGVARDIQSGATPDAALASRMQGAMRTLDGRPAVSPVKPISPP